MNNYSDQQLPISFNNFNQFQNDESLHSSHPSSSSSSFNLTPDKHPNTIKERLNLHVKRKILENSVTSTTTVATKPIIGNCTVTSQQYQQLNQQKINNISKSPNISGTNSSNTTDSAIIPKRKRKNKKIGTASTSRSVSRTGGNGGDDSQDGNLSCHDTNSNSTNANTVTATTTTTNSKNKDNKKEPGILAQILNQKKIALMRDPEIIELFNKMTKKLENNNKNINNTNQAYHQS